jgi:hypothetical protein
MDIELINSFHCFDSVIVIDNMQMMFGPKLQYKNHFNEFIWFQKCNTKVSLYEPRHDKTNITGLRPAWIQTSQPYKVYNK